MDAASYTHRRHIPRFIYLPVLVIAEGRRSLEGDLYRKLVKACGSRCNGLPVNNFDVCADWMA